MISSYPKVEYSQLLPTGPCNTHSLYNTLPYSKYSSFPHQSNSISRFVSAIPRMVKTKVSEIPKITYQADMMDELKAAHVLMGIGAPEAVAVADGVPSAAAVEESRCGGGDEESRPSSKADEINIPPWTLIIPKLEEHTNLLQLPDDQVVGVRLPADLDSVSASTAVMLVPVLGGTMSLLKKKLRKEVAGYDEDDDDDNEEKNVGNQHEMNQEEGGQRKENKHKEDVIVLSDDDEDDEEEKAGKVYSKPLLMKMKVDDLRHLAVKLRLKNSSWDSKEKLVDRIAKALGVCNE